MPGWYRPSCLYLSIRVSIHKSFGFHWVTNEKETSTTGIFVRRTNPPFKYKLWIQSWWTKQTWNRMTNSNIPIQNYEWKATLVYCLNDAEIMMKHKTCKFEEHILILEATMHYITHWYQRVIPSLPLQQYISCLPGSNGDLPPQRICAPQCRTWIERTEPNACHKVIS